MRISTSTIFETGSNQLGTLQSQLARTQMQLSTNRRMLTAADDPVASARALEVTQSKSINSQFATNRMHAGSSLAQVDMALGNATELLQQIQTLAVQAGNGSYSQVEREALANELAGRFEDLLGVANTADGAGGYLFSGFQSATAPFTQTATGAGYNGDQGQRQLQVGSARTIQVSESGSAIFDNAMSGNGTFKTAPMAGNAGSGVISSGSVTNAQQLTRQNYRIDFAVSGATPPVTTYSVINVDTGLPPAAPAPAGPQPYQSGQQITFDGMSFDITGVPADGDRFTVEPSKKQSVFTTVTELINTLRNPATGAAGQAARGNGLGAAQSHLNATLENMLGVRASVGARMKELDYLESAGQDRDIQYASTLSDLQDLDLAKAISEFSQQQMMLEAAQKSFKTMSGLSLFNYIG